MVQKIIFVMVGVLLLSSCSHIAVKKKAKDISFKVTGSVLDHEGLMQGGTLGIAPFKAGPYAEANDELDRVSNMVIKGIKETLDMQKSSLQVIDATQGNPQIGLEGYVEELTKPGKLSRMLMRPNQNTLTLVGDLWLTTNGKRLLEFSISQKFNPKRISVADVGYRMGQEIGKFIAYNTAKEDL